MRLHLLKRTAAVSAGLLVVSLVAVVGLAKALTPTVESGIAYLDVPKAVVGIVIAALVLLPEAAGGGQGGSEQSIANQFEPGIGISYSRPLA